MVAALPVCATWMTGSQGTMRPTTSIVCLLALMLALAVSAMAAPVPAGPKVAARSYVLQDFHSGYVMDEQDPTMRVEPASLTKMMTAYVVFNELREGHIHLEDQVRVSEKAWRMPGSRMFIEVDKHVSVGDLLKGMIIQSGNDASVALAEHVAGSEDAFAELMNQYAKRLGMTGTHFVNSTGLPDPEHYTTARDMAILAGALIREFPKDYKWHAMKEFTYNGITQHNRNKLLWRDKSVDGIKTGHTESAGYCLAASAMRDDMRLIAVVMGTESENARAEETQKLLNYGFRFFETHTLYKRHDPVTQVRVWEGELEDLSVGLADDLYVTVPRGQYKKLQASMQMDGPVIAPVSQGQVLGMLRVALGDEELAQRKMVSLQDVPEGTLWHRLLDHVMLMFE
jgi:D-alanyl-D-alanine carboxypeptidase (penicillin-binding protein 5/6)